MYVLKKNSSIGVKLKRNLKLLEIRTFGHEIYQELLNLDKRQLDKLILRSFVILKLNLKGGLTYLLNFHKQIF